MNHDLIIRDGTVVDGTGADPFQADVAIAGDEIVEIGKVAGKGKQEIRAEDEFVSAFLKDLPGFLSFVKAGIVHDDQGAGLQFLKELFLDVLVKNGGVQVPLKKEWC